MDESQRVNRTSEWRARLAYWTVGFLAFETLSGLSIWLLPFSIPNQFLVLVHTVAGLVFLVPVGWYLLRHWLLYRPFTLNHVKLLGYLGIAVLLACGASGVVLTWQALLGRKISYFWDLTHIVSTVGILAFVVPHIWLIVARLKPQLAGQAELVRAAADYYLRAGGVVLAGITAVWFLAYFAWQPVQMENEFPPDYSYVFGKDRPFAPSLARTDTGGAIDARAFAGSLSCGTAGCHEEIVREWEPSAHRYAAMDPGFQKIQLTMAQQNGPESTRYCGGCHDPISLFSGTKNIFTDESELTGLHGYREGVSCLSCHAIRETDLKGNAHYVITQPNRYVFEIEYDQHPSEPLRIARDFLIRAYPGHHVESLSKRLFKTPEYCAACHKQFIDQEINKTGWVQLQNQFDNWRKSNWNHPGEPDKTVECRECHMPLVDSNDPAAGDSLDYNRRADDGMHRSHRFIAANQLVPPLLKLPGWEEQVWLTEQWLRGEYEIPEIAHKWAAGPAVSIELMAPQSVSPGEQIEIKTVITSNKVGHDFPTGPLDIIQAWLEIIATDDDGNLVYASGVVDSQGFIQPGSFIFKAEPVDQYGNLIDRHNLWEMVGVRQRRALFPGFSDFADFRFFCPELFQADPRTRRRLDGETSHALSVPTGSSRILNIRASLNYRKVDQYLLNFMFGEGKLTSPVTEMAVAKKTIQVLTGSEVSRTGE